MIERRQHKRYLVHGEAILETDGESLVCQIADLSEGGIGLILPAPRMLEEKTVKVTVSERYWKAVFQAEVRWQNRERIGLKIVSSKVETRKSLGAIFQTILKDLREAKESPT